MGTTTHRPFHINRKREMSSLLLQGRDGSWLHRRRSDDTMDIRSSLPFPSYPSAPKDYCQTVSGAVQCNPHCFMVAKTIMVHHAPFCLHRLHLSPPSTPPSHSESGSNLPPRSSRSPPNSVKNSPSIAAILARARKPASCTLINGLLFLNL